MKNRIEVLITMACLFVLSFVAGRAAFSRPAEARVQAALETVWTDGQNTLCGAASSCLPARPAYTLFVFFSPRDCAISLYETALLEELHRSVPRGVLAVVGVGYDLDRATARKFAAASGISYPLYLRPEAMEHLIGAYRRQGGNKPFKVLVDASGEVIDAGVSGASVQEHREYLADVRALLGARGGAS